MAGLKDLIGWWKRRSGGPWRVVGTVEEADDIPRLLPKDGAILVGSARAPKWLAFDCPCDTGHRILLNLQRARRPYWRITSVKRLTVWPSVDAKNGDRRCHFLFDRGHAVWVHEEAGYD